jgi:hypothetical protein
MKLPGDRARDDGPTGRLSNPEIVPHPSADESRGAVSAGVGMLKQVERRQPYVGDLRDHLAITDLERPLARPEGSTRTSNRTRTMHAVADSVM